jgi:hypothetical protein
MTVMPQKERSLLFHLDSLRVCCHYAFRTLALRPEIA